MSGGADTCMCLGRPFCNTFHVLLPGMSFFLKSFVAQILSIELERLMIPEYTRVCISSYRVPAFSVTTLSNSVHSKPPPSPSLGPQRRSLHRRRRDGYMLFPLCVGRKTSIQKPPASSHDFSVLAQKRNLGSTYE